MWVVAAASAAESEIESDMGVEKVVGFSNDGLWFVLEGVRETPAAQHHFALALRDDGTHKLWSLAEKGPTPDIYAAEWDQEAELKQAPGAPEYEAWRAEQGVSAAKAGRKCGEVEVYVDNIPASAWSTATVPVTWRGDAFSTGSDAYLVMGVARGDLRWELGRVFPGTTMGSWFSSTPSHVYWTPSCSRLVVVSIDPSVGSGRSDNYTSYGDRVVELNAYTAGPRIGVVGGGADAARGALEAAGFGAGLAKETPPAHEGTVVYAWSKAMPYAEKVAAAIPGARVEPMSWKSALDVVVAVP